CRQRQRRRCGRFYLTRKRRRRRGSPVLAAMIRSSRVGSISVVAAALGVAAMVVPGCRKPRPDELAYTGAQTGPSTGGSSGASGSGGTGGTATDAGGASGHPGELPGTAPDVPFSKANLLTQIADCAIS